MSFRWNIGLSLFLHGLAFSLIAAHSCGGDKSHRAVGVLQVELAEGGRSAMRGGEGGAKVQASPRPEAHNPPAPQTMAYAGPPLTETLQSVADGGENAEAAGVFLALSPPGDGKEAEGPTVGLAAGQPTAASAGGGAGGAARSDHAAEIQAAIERAKGYPLAARRKGISGTVVVGFYVNAGGRAERIKVVNSSGHEVLDREAVGTVRRADRFPPIERSVTVPITFRLLE